MFRRLCVLSFHFGEQACAIGYALGEFHVNTAIFMEVASGCLILAFVMIIGTQVHDRFNSKGYRNDR